MVRVILIGICFLFFACGETKNSESNQGQLSPKSPYILVLGNAQDAGYPQINCQKDCCKRLDKNPELSRFVSSIALVDPISDQSWIFDATPDFPAQVKLLSTHLKNKTMPDGVFLTHGHIGHYTGLMYLGKEAMGADKMPVYAMPRMQTYLSNHGPWSQLVALNNLNLHSIKNDSTMVLNERLKVTPFLVPHRDEYTETVGYKISINQKKILFIPDIDKWQKWERNIIDEIKNVDLALLDATFYQNGEIDRDMNLVPHPFVTESMDLFSGLSEKDKNKVYFIHFNHTNPLLIEGSAAQQEVRSKGFRVAEQGMIIEL